MQGFGKVAILGVGLIGASVAAALRRSGTVGEIVGWTPNDDAGIALARGLLDRVASDVESAADSADMVVIAAPVNQAPDLLARLAPVLDARTVVTDCGSTKGSTIAAARDTLGAGFDRFVPGHPIAGSERSGPLAADPDLFRNRRWLLCPLPDTSVDACARVRDLIAPTGAIVETMPADFHDRLFAEVSHWPHALAFALSAAIAGGEFGEVALLQSGAGLRDTTRIGASSPGLWAGILLDNRQACLESAARFRACLERIESALALADRDGLEQVFAEGAQWRSRIG
jgi:prephenate dehydrogenase